MARHQRVREPRRELAVVTISGPKLRDVRKFLYAFALKVLTGRKKAFTIFSKVFTLRKTAFTIFVKVKDGEKKAFAIFVKVNTLRKIVKEKILTFRASMVETTQFGRYSCTSAHFR